MSGIGGLVSALVLDADLTAGSAGEALTHLPGTAYLVVIDTHHHPPRYFVLQAGSVRKELVPAADDLSIRTALGLDDRDPVTTLDVLTASDGWRGAESGAVVLRGRTVLGVFFASGGTRGTGRNVAPQTPGAASAPPPESVPAVEAAPPTQSDLGRFRAFPCVSGPAQAPAGTQFQVEVGFTVQAQSPDAQAIIKPDAPPAVTFEIQVDGFGFQFPDGVRKSLTVERDNPTSATERFTVSADDVVAPIGRSIEVTFSIDGGVVGLAWCDLQVFPAAETEGSPENAEHDETPAIEPGQATGTGTGGGSAIGTQGVEPADLTVTILTDQGRPELHWLFHTPHDVPRPHGQVAKDLPAANAQAFAEQLMAELPALKGSGMLHNELRGLGLRVSDVLPVEFWHVLAAVWEKVHVKQPARVPTLMLVTSEPFVPWELAWVEGDQHVPAALLKAGPGAEAQSADGATTGSNKQLGALWAVGRWIIPTQQPLGPARPVAPPDAVIDATTMAVVIGEYKTPGIADLPGAVEEGKRLAADYDAVSVDVDEEQVLQLLDDALTRDNKPYRPAIVHMATHGKVGMAAQQHTGIVLRNKRVVGPFVIEGSKLGRVSRPFVFLNACQVGMASRVLNAYGGLASAFLVSGCRGFVAPLWNVDDDVARDLSQVFYEEVLGQGVTVGEAVRRIRAAFLADPKAAPSATPMAYVFYGHPNLVLRRPKES